MADVALVHPTPIRPLGLGQAVPLAQSDYPQGDLASSRKNLTLSIGLLTEPLPPFPCDLNQIVGTHAIGLSHIDLAT